MMRNVTAIMKSIITTEKSVHADTTTMGKSVHADTTTMKENAHADTIITTMVAKLRNTA